jgi:hypothetical protein
MKSDKTIPRVATRWVVVMMVFLVAVFGWIAKTGFDNNWPLYAIVMFEVSWLLLGLVCLWGFVSQILTRFDAKGVSQFTLRGPVRIQWENVTSMSNRPKGVIELSDGSTFVRISSVMYSPQPDLYRWIEQRLQRSNAPAVSNL